MKHAIKNKVRKNDFPVLLQREITIIVQKRKRQRLPTCLHPIDGYAKSAVYCLFPLDIYKYDPSRKQTGVSASQTSWYQRGDGSLLHITSKRLRESCSRDAPLRLHLMLRRRRREGGREGWGRKKKKKKTQKGCFFFTRDKSCSHMGGTRPSALTKG